MYKAIYADGLCYGTVKVPENVPGEFISEETAMHINALIEALPKPTETTDYRLREDLTWEEYTIDSPPIESDALSADEILSILLGGN